MSRDKKEATASTYELHKWDLKYQSYTKEKVTEDATQYASEGGGPVEWSSNRLLALSAALARRGVTEISHGQSVQSKPFREWIKIRHRNEPWRFEGEGPALCRG